MKHIGTLAALGWLAATLLALILWGTLRAEAERLKFERDFQEVTCSERVKKTATDGAAALLRCQAELSRAHPAFQLIPF